MFNESKYYTKVDIDNKGYLTSIPVEYITEQILNDSIKSFVTLDTVYSKTEIDDKFNNLPEQEPTDLTGYATELWVKEYTYDKATVDQKLTDAITSGTVDLSNYYTKQEVYNKAEIDSKFENLDIPDADLTGYATEQWVKDQGYLTEHQSLEGYATEGWVENQNYLKEHQDLSEYAKLTDIPTIPTSNSAFTNDEGYITLDEVPQTDLSNYYNKSEVDELIDNIEVPGGTGGSIEDAPADGKVYGRQNNTWTEVVSEEPDLSNYYTKTEADQTYATKEDVTITEVAEVSNGVYAVTEDGELIDYNTADSSCLGVALVQGEHKFMIAKADATNDGSNYKLYYDYDKGDLSLTNYSNADGTSGNGYLGGSSTPQLSQDFTTWTAGALSDFNGKSNTQVIAASSSNAKDMCKVLETFNAGSGNQGHSDWYVPACGQLALMHLNMTEINAVLAKIGGTALAAGSYWSSSEYSSGYAWSVYFDNCYVRSDNKDYFRRVRFVRDISPKEKTPLKDYTLGLNGKIEVKQDKNLYFSNVQASNWVDSTEYSEYPYQCDLVCEGVRPEYYPEVVFGASEAASGNYAALCESLTDAVRIYSKVNTSIVIPTIQISK